MSDAPPDAEPTSRWRTSCALGCGSILAFVLVIAVLPPARQGLARVLVGSTHGMAQLVGIAGARALGPEAAVPALIELLEQSPSHTERARAAWALGETNKGAEAAVPALTRALQDENAQVRYEAVAALSMILPYVSTRHPETEAVLEALAAGGGEDTDLRDWAARTLELMHERGLR